MRYEFIAILIFLLVAIIGFVIFIAIPAIKNKAPVAGRILDTTKKVVNAADDLTDTLVECFPFPTFALIDKIIDYADIAVDKAEQLYHTGELTTNRERQDAAKNYITDILRMAGQEITPELDRLIDGTIEAFVSKLGHTEPAAALLSPSEEEQVTA